MLSRINRCLFDSLIRKTFVQSGNCYGASSNQNLESQNDPGTTGLEDCVIVDRRIERRCESSSGGIYEFTSR